MSFGLMIFYTKLLFVRQAVEHGASHVIIDLEQHGKDLRQKNYDTQINAHSLADIGYVKAHINAPVVARINAVGGWTPAEIDAVLGEGADEILVPMVRSRDEIDLVMAVTNGRCGVGIMVETIPSLNLLPYLKDYALARVYVGLNDLWIERRTPHQFTAFIDGTLDYIADYMMDIPWGVAGLTLPDMGHPLPCHHLMNEMARLGCGFSFLRRSFMRDIQNHSLELELSRILQRMKTAATRDKAHVEHDRLVAHQAIANLPPGPWTL